MQTLLIVSSDHHINSTVALCPPTVNLDDGGTYHASPGQRWLWESWQDAWKRCAELARGVDRVIAVLNGDIGELDTKRRSNQLVTPNKAMVLRMAGDVFEPLLDVAKDVYVVRGTAAHEGKSSWLEEAFAQDIDGIIPDKAHKTNSWWHVRGQVNGLKVDIAHHAPMGATPWGKFTAPANLWAKTQWFYQVDMQAAPPDLVIRSHNHKCVTGDPVYFTPCWSLITEHGYRIGRENDKPDIGLLAFVINGKDYKCHKMLYSPKDAKRVWSVAL
jgi:hypothetical protein